MRVTGYDKYRGGNPITGEGYELPPSRGKNISGQPSVHYGPGVANFLPPKRCVRTWHVQYHDTTCLTQVLAHAFLRPSSPEGYRDLLPSRGVGGALHGTGPVPRLRLGAKLVPYTPPPLSTPSQRRHFPAMKSPEGTGFSSPKGTNPKQWDSRQMDAALRTDAARPSHGLVSNPIRRSI